MHICRYASHARDQACNYIIIVIIRRWLAPEVVTQQHYSKAADVYSFGLILWELLTWQLPWADLGPFQARTVCPVNAVIGVSLLLLC